MNPPHAHVQPDDAVTQTGMEGQAVGEVEYTYTRDAVFYDDAIVFSVEQVNFRVSRILIERGSGVFKTMLSLPQGEYDAGAPNEGACDASPINLPGVTADEFRDFLRVLYANLVEMDKHYLGFRNIPSNWTSVLKLATLWEFDPIRKQAIQMLIGQEPVTRIVLAQTYHIKGWMEDALYSLVHQDEALDLADFTTLGQHLAFGIVKLRETVLKRPDRRIERPHPWLEHLGEVFGAEFVDSLKQEWGSRE